MEEQLTHLVVNWIDVNDNIVLVGATDNERWKWETDMGSSGADAKSIVWVTLTDNGKGYAVSEQAHFFCYPGDPTRSLAMSNILGLFEIAWAIKNENMEGDNAREKFFGKTIEETISHYTKI